MCPAPTNAITGRNARRHDWRRRTGGARGSALRPGRLLEWRDACVRVFRVTGSTLPESARANRAAANARRIPIRTHSVALFLSRDPAGNENEIIVPSSNALRLSFIYFFDPPTPFHQKIAMKIARTLKYSQFRSFYFLHAQCYCTICKSTGTLPIRAAILSIQCQVQSSRQLLDKTGRQPLAPTIAKLQCPRFRDDPSVRAR